MTIPQRIFGFFVTLFGVIAVAGAVIEIVAPGSFLAILQSLRRLSLRS